MKLLQLLGHSFLVVCDGQGAQEIDSSRTVESLQLKPGDFLVISLCSQPFSVTLTLVADRAPKLPYPRNSLLGSDGHSPSIDQI